MLFYVKIGTAFFRKINLDRKNSYTIDKKNKIVGTSSTWDEFALENDGGEIVSKKVIGRSIWNFVKGDHTRMWLQTVFELVRLKGESIERPYRCDSPDVRRFMKMNISPLPDGKIKLEHEILKTEERERPVVFKYSPESGSKIRFRCSLCGKIKVGNDWAEPDESDYKEIIQKYGGIIVAYTICPECKTTLPSIR